MKHNFLLIVILFLLSVSGCGKKESRAPESQGKPSIDFAGKKMGVLLGSVHDSYARKNYPNAEIFQYHTIPDMIMSLTSGKVEVAIIGHVTLKNIMKKDDRIGILRDSLYSNPLGCGFNKESKTLKDQFNSFLKEIKANGIYDDMDALVKRIHSRCSGAASGCFIPVDFVGMRGIK